MTKWEVILILDNIRSVFNAGSIFRTAETLGISKIYCCGTTPTPKDRFGRLRKDFAKVSLGSEQMVDWEHLSQEKVASFIKSLKKGGYQVIALEQDPRSVDYKNLLMTGKCVIVLGSEVDGVDKMILEISDHIAEIPLAGKKESLNVSVATGIFLYRLLDK